MPSMDSERKSAHKSPVAGVCQEEGEPSLFSRQPELWGQVDEFRQRLKEGMLDGSLTLTSPEIALLVRVLRVDDLELLSQEGRQLAVDKKGLHIIPASPGVRDLDAGVFADVQTRLEYMEDFHACAYTDRN